MFTKGARSLSVTEYFCFLSFLISDSLEGQGEFINEENPFLNGAVTGAVCVCEYYFGMCECVNAQVRVILVKFWMYFSNSTNTDRKCISLLSLSH